VKKNIVRYLVGAAVIIIILSLCIGTYFNVSKNHITEQKGNNTSNNTTVMVENYKRLVPYQNKSKEKLEDFNQVISAILGNESGDYSIGYCNLSEENPLLINSKKMPSASIIKLFIMVHAYKEVSLKALDLDEKLVVRQEDKVGGTGSLGSRQAGTTISIRELINLMITESDNTATNILINNLGFDKINQTIKDMAFKDTTLQRKMMDFSSAEQGKENYTSVSDLVTVLYKIANNQCLGQPYDQEMLSILKRQKQRNMIPRGVPDTYTVANKCGNLPGVVNDAAIIYSEDGGYVLCVLCGDVTQDSGESTIVAISKAVFDYYEN